MKIKIEIPDDSVEYLSDQAKQEVSTLSKGFIVDLLSESSRLEAAGRSGTESAIVKRDVSSPNEARWKGLNELWTS